jgi:hypothetical protein
MADRKVYEVVTKETVTRYYRLKLPPDHPYSDAVDALATGHDVEPTSMTYGGEEVIQVDAVDGSTFSGALRRWV